MDLTPSPVSEHVNLDDKKKAEIIKHIHERVKFNNIEQRTEQYAKQANKGQHKLVKEWFSERRKSKLLPRGDSQFQVLEQINDNAYKLNCYF